MTVERSEAIKFGSVSAIGVYLLSSGIVSATGDHTMINLRSGRVEQQVGFAFLLGGIFVAAGVQKLGRWCRANRWNRPQAVIFGTLVAIGATTLLAVAALADARLLFGGTLMWTPWAAFDPALMDGRRKAISLQVAFLGDLAALPALVLFVGTSALQVVEVARVPRPTKGMGGDGASAPP